LLQFDALVLLLVFAVAVAIISYTLKFPYSIALVVFGVIVGTVAVFFPSLGAFASSGGLFSSDVFFGILLPPLIYEASLHIDYRLLKSRVRLILFLAFLGVVISSFLTGFLVSAFVGMPFLFALLLGAILSPTDPVAVVDLFKRLHVPEELATIIESESILNDGAGVVLFTAVLQLASQTGFTILTPLAEFVQLVLGGLLVGLLFSAGAYLLHRHIDEPNLETALSIVTAYGSFHLATALGASGIISTTVTGIATGTWVAPRAMGEEVRETLFSFWRVVAYVVNSLIFLSIGLLVNLGEVLINLPFVLAILGVVTLARASFIYANYPFSRLFRSSSSSSSPSAEEVSRTERMPISWYNTLVVAGVRGALPIVLAFTLLSETASPIPVSVRSTIATLVIGTALISVTLQNVVASWYIKRRFGSQKVSK
jgi:CPA1 family monovalent cation:H+ antiporter